MWCEVELQPLELADVCCPSNKIQYIKNLTEYSYPMVSDVKYGVISRINNISDILFLF